MPYPDVQATLAALIQAAGESADAALAYCVARAEAAGGRVVARVEPAAVLIQRADDTRAPLVLSGHVDVVPAGDGWDVPPFGGIEKDGKVWGRGASDMLAAVACFLHVFEEHPDLPLALAFTTDEEVGMLGAAALADGGHLDAVAGIVIGEPTDFAVGVAEKGVAWFHVEAHGRPAHGSTPERGENAAEKLIDAWPRIRAVTWPDEHPLLGRTTRNLGTIAAGTAMNVVAAHALAEVDVRFLPGQTAAAIGAAFQDAAGPGVTVRLHQEFPPFAARDDSPLVEAALAAVRAARGEAEAVGLAFGTEAARFAARADCVVVGPGHADVIHTEREHITLEALAGGHRMYAELVTRFFAEGRT